MRRNSRAAMTLVEMLVAMAVTLVMMGAVVTLFGNIGSSITGSRAVMEISERLRNCRNVLQDDLKNVTVTMLPPRRPESDEGYFEYIEGPSRDNWDFTPSATSTGKGLFGDIDDVLCFTVRSRGEPYVGKADTSVTSQTAEVIWYLLPNDPTGPAGPGPQLPTGGTPLPLFTLYRRVMLVAPGSDSTHVSDPYDDFIHNHDISVRPAIDPGTGLPTATGVEFNTLGDLTKRENRWMHRWPAKTFPFELGSPLVPTGNIIPLGNPRAGEDIILTNVLAFDVKAFDPMVPVHVTSTGVATLPSDAGYSSSGWTLGGTGGYVDLNYANAAGSSFSGPPQAGSGLTVPTYDTWSLHYDAAGPGLDGLDNGGVAGVVDDPGEMQTPPPYPVPLRGIQIKIRVYEPDSRQVREVTVVQDFLPQ